MTEREAMERFGRNLKKVLDKCNMSQTELSELTGLSKSTISRYIEGTRVPTLSTIIKILYVTDCDFYELIDFYGKIE